MAGDRPRGWLMKSGILLPPSGFISQRVLTKLDQDVISRDMIEKSMNRILLEVENLNGLLVEFREFSRQRPPVLESCNFLQFLHEITEVYEASYPDAYILTDNVPADLVLEFDLPQFRQVFNNLITNAIHAMDGNGLIIIRADLVKKGYSVYCRIQISDTGPGIDPDNQEKIFNPYYTTREEGTGLGLSIVERIVFDHKGRIWVESAAGEGTSFFIDLPYGEFHGTNTDN